MSVALRGVLARPLRLRRTAGFQIQPDHPVTVRFFVQYDLLNTAPRLRAIRLNGNVICNDDTHQRATGGRPVFSNVRQQGSSLPGHLSEKPMQSPQNNYPVYQRPVNNSSADFKYVRHSGHKLCGWHSSPIDIIDIFVRKPLQTFVLKARTKMIVALCAVVALLAAPSVEQGSEDSTLTTPCPGVFRYTPPEKEPGLWAGVATLSTEHLLHSMWLNIVLDRPALAVSLLFRHWVGNTTTRDNLDFRIDNDDLQILPGHPVVVRFYVKHDPLNTTPRLRAIRLNGKVICNAEPLQSPQGDTSSVYSRPVNVSPGFFSPAFTTGDECGVVAGGNERVPLINNGFFYERGDIPWLVAIYRAVESDLIFICAGTLVTDRHVVTAAHCMRRPSVSTDITEIVVKIGVHSLHDWSDDMTVTRKLMAATMHEEFNPFTLQNDILILTLNKRVKFNRYIRPACLWSGGTELSRVVGASGVVAGWGGRSVEDIRGKLDEPQMVRVPIVSTKECRASKSDFHRLTYNTTLCAGDRNGAGPCKGDSGGGLYLLDDGKWRLRGVVSISVQSENGALTCNLNEYVVYTDTAQFLPWIRNILSQKYYD